MFIFEKRALMKKILQNYFVLLMTFARLQKGG
ncbi:hypothetical protein MHYMCMPASI_00486 [Hyalomma marginatum]|uniref:Uncharacterized protein n=1 Tax=Hyalomma marginatum TaxID=34627 RepID=A0A8S4BUL6_9ACAR|nr:hypothetical protein MHYMCMPASI_00486 [Hyalomma marginatum]